MSLRAKLLAVLLAGFLCVGCGWHTGVGPELRDPATSRAFPAGTTVGVELFGRARSVLERNLEPELHAALARAVLNHAGLELVSADEADLVLRGEVLDYRRRGGVRSINYELRETGVHLRVAARLVERASGDEIASARPRVWTSYQLDGAQREVAARERGWDFLARKLVFDLFQSSGIDEPVDPNLDSNRTR